MTNDKCPQCGAMYALVGFRHLCRPKPAPLPIVDAVQDRLVVQPSKVAASPGKYAGVYAKRDLEKWRPHMAEYMRGWRARKKAAHGQA